MQLSRHAAVSAVFSAAFFAATHSRVIAVSFFLAGVFIDLDHVIDYWRVHPFKTDPAHFFATCEEHRLKKVYLYLHSIELVFLLFVFTLLARSAVFFGITCGFLVHLICDQLSNRVYPFSYLFFYRWAKGFEINRAFDVPYYGQTSESITR